MAVITTIYYDHIASLSNLRNVVEERVREVARVMILQRNYRVCKNVKVSNAVKYKSPSPVSPPKNDSLAPLRPP